MKYFKFDGVVHSRFVSWCQLIVKNRPSSLVILSTSSSPMVLKNSSMKDERCPEQ